MQPLVTTLILASALLHALWNAMLKRQRDPEGAAIAIVAVATALALAAVPFTPRPWFADGDGLTFALLAGLGEAGYFATLALALRQAPLNVAYTISRGGSLAAVWPVSALWLGERVTSLSASGAITVGAGLLLVGLGRSGRASARGVFWAILCALFIAGYHLAYKRALATGAQPAAVFAAALALTLPLNFARLGRGSTTRVGTSLRASPLVLLGAGVICAASFLVFLFALASGGAGAVMTLRNTSVVFALLLSWVIGERPDTPQFVGALAVAAGAVLLGWPG